MIAIAESPKRVAFPASQLKATLEQWWETEALERSNDPFAKPPKATGTIYDLLPALDSLTIIRSFIVIEKVLDFQVPVTLVKAGGYSTRDEMLKDLLPKLRELYEKRQK